MSVTIDSRGLFEQNDGANNLSVAGVASITTEVMVAATVAGSGSVALPYAGFFQVPATGSAGQGQFTGSVPSPASNPGGTLVVTDPLGVYPYLLTGTFAMVTTVSTGSVVFASTTKGTKLTVSAGGSAGMMSDTKGWLVIAASGTLQLAP